MSQDKYNQGATGSLALYRTGRSVTFNQYTRQIIGSALGMELARSGKHKKLVLYVKLAAVTTRGGTETLDPERIVPHYALDPTTVQK